MGYKDTTLEIIKGYNDEKRLLTQSWLESGAEIRKEITARINEIDKLLRGFKDPISGSDDEG